MQVLYLMAATVVFYLIYKGINSLNEKMLGKKEVKGYTMQLTGEVVGLEKEKKLHVIGALLGKYSGTVRHYEYNVYRTVVRYQVNGTVYETAACEDSPYVPVAGRRAMVFVDRENPANARIWTDQKYKKRLKIWKRDEKYVYCSCGLKKEIRIPIYLVEEGAVPGRYLVERYGYYHLYQPEDEKQRTAKGFVRELGAGIAGDPLYDERKNEWERES